MEYFINSMIYQMLKFFKRITSFYPEMILRHIKLYHVIMFALYLSLVIISTLE